MIPSQPEEALSPALVGQIEGAVKPGLPIAVRLPPDLLPLPQILAGRYFLVRCSSVVGIEREGDWSIFLRRPLFVCGRQPQDRGDRWQLYLPTGPAIPGLGVEDETQAQIDSDAGFRWLAQRVAGELLNLCGPFGNGFRIGPNPHNLLLLVDDTDDAAWFWQLHSLCEQTLDRGGRATILIRAERDEEVAALMPSLPVQVEVRTASDEAGWVEQLRHTVSWADQVCAGIPASRYRELLNVVRESRIHVDRDFVQVLFSADLLCGVGACLVCVVPNARGGLTRACVNGPVFDLLELVD